MPRYPFKIILLMAIILISMSCTVSRGKVTDRPGAHDLHAKEVGPYYYYTQSHLMQKRGDIGKAIAFLRQAVARDEGSIFLRTELARLYVQHNDQKQALKIMKEIVKENPKHVPSVIMMGGIYSTLNRHAEAIEAYRKAMELDPKSERVYLLLGSEYVKNKKPKQAVEIFETFVQTHPDSFVGNFHLGTVAASLDRYDLAEKAFLKCLKLKPGYKQTLFELVNLYEATKDDHKVVEMYKKILDTNPDSIRAAVGLGQYYLKLGRESEAEKVFEELMLRRRSNPLVMKQIALIYLDQKCYRQAARTLETLLGDTQNSELYYFLGMALEGLKNTDRAIEAYEKVGDASSYYSSALVHLSFLFQEKGDREKAVELMNRSLEKEPNEPGPYLFLGALYEEMQAYDKAIETFRKGLALKPDHVRLHFRLGVVYDKAGNKQGCIDEMKTVIKIDPTHAEALNYLGYTYAELGMHLDEAEKLIKKAMEYKPKDGYITDSLGWVYFKRGMFQKAIKFLNSAAEFVPDDPTILEHLGDAHVEAKEIDKALMFYKRALKNAEKGRGPLEKKIETLENNLDKKN